MVARKTIKPRVAQRVLMYRARKELPVKTDRGRIKRGEMVTAEKAEAIASHFEVELSEMFEAVEEI